MRLIFALLVLASCVSAFVAPVAPALSQSVASRSSSVVAFGGSKKAAPKKAAPKKAAPKKAAKIASKAPKTGTPAPGGGFTSWLMAGRDLELLSGLARPSALETVGKRFDIEYDTRNRGKGPAKQSKSK